MKKLNLPLMSDNIDREDVDCLIEFLKQEPIPRLTNGPKVIEFEEKWSKWLGVEHSVLVNSGTAANELTMLALKYKYPEGGEIIVPPLTWISDINSVLFAEVNPVFVDINLNNFRNFEKFFLEFKNGCNIILGKNGSGKTNILESLSLLEKGRGFRKEKIENLINFNKRHKDFKILSLFNNENINFNIAAFSLNQNKKKITVNDNSDLTSIKHFESLFSIIYFLPEMERLFVSSPSFRRNFLDRLIFNFNKNYNTVVNKYKKAITERQLLLKDSQYDESWIQNIENNIVEYGSVIYKNREDHIKVLNQIL